MCLLPGSSPSWEIIIARRWEPSTLPGGGLLWTTGHYGRRTENETCSASPSHKISFYFQTIASYPATLCTKLRDFLCILYLRLISNLTEKCKFVQSVDWKKAIEIFSYSLILLFFYLWSALPLGLIILREWRGTCIYSSSVVSWEEQTHMTNCWLSSSCYVHCCCRYCICISKGSHSWALTVTLAYRTLDNVEFVQCVTNIMQIYMYTGLCYPDVPDDQGNIWCSWSKLGEEQKRIFHQEIVSMQKYSSLTHLELHFFFLTNSSLSLSAPSWLSHLHHTCAASSSSQDNGWCEQPCFTAQIYKLKPDKIDFAWFVKGNVVVSTKFKVWNKPHLWSSVVIGFGTLMSVSVL